MQKKQILIVCTHITILQTIIRLVNQHEGWYGIAAENYDQALHIYQRKSIDLVLLGAGLTEAEENELTKRCNQNQTTCVRHYGGGSGLLYTEIYKALPDSQ